MTRILLLARILLETERRMQRKKSHRFIMMANEFFINNKWSRQNFFCANLGFCQTERTKESQRISVVLSDSHFFFYWLTLALSGFLWLYPSLQLSVILFLFKVESLLQLYKTMTFPRKLSKNVKMDLEDSHIQIDHQICPNEPKKC